MANMNFILILLLGISVLGCKKQQKQALEAQVVITPLATEHIVKDLMPYIDTIILIPLETTDRSLVNEITKLLLLPEGDVVIKSGGNLLLFGPDGTFRFQIGQSGRGPEEYKYIEDCCLSQDEKEVWVLVDDEIVVYSTENGKFVRKISMEIPVDCMGNNALASGKNGSVFVYHCPGMQETNFKEDFYCLYQYDPNGKMIQHYLPRKDFGVEIGLITQSWDNQYILRPQDNSHICYYLSDSLPQPKVKIDFGDKTIPERYSFDLQTYLYSNYYKMPIFIHDTPENFYFVFCGPEAREHYCIHSFVTNRTITWKRQGQDSEGMFNILGSDKTFFYGIYSDYRSPEELPMAQLDLLKKAIVNKTRIQIPDEDNPYLVKIKFKI